MKRFILTLIFLLAICTAFFFALSMPRGMGNYRAINGTLDLTNADFSHTRHNLDGEWDFFFAELLTPEDFINGTATDRTTIDVPGSWHTSGYPLYGYATYRLIIKTDQPSLMMFLPHIPSASIVWINGEKVFEAGAIGEATPQAIGGRNAFVPFGPVDGQVEVIIQASNYAWFFSGINFSIEIGRAELILNDAMVRRVVLGIFTGILIAMFVYQFIMFFHRRREWIYLAFALYCIMTALRFSMETNGFLLLFGNYGHVERSIFQIIMTLKVVGLVAFTHFAFDMLIGKVRCIIYAATLGIPILSAIALPFGTIDSRIIFMPTIPLVMMFISTLQSKRLHENYYNYLYLIALCFIAIAQPIQRFTPIDQHLYMPAAAHNLFMVLTQFFMLSMSYAQTKEAEQRLSKENAALDRLSRMKTKYLADMSHETKTPLAVVSLHVQQAAILYEDSGQQDKTISESLRRAQEVLKHISRMTENTMRFASMQEVMEWMKPIETAPLIKGTAEAYRTILEKRSNRLILKVPDNLPLVLGNSDELVQVLVNLFTNAGAYTKSGEITVTAQVTEPQPFILVSVTDTGTGIDPKLLPRIFERSVSGSHGTGFGLAISKEIIESHGGTIEAESEASKGTAVTFTLPVFEERGGGIDV